MRIVAVLLLAACGRVGFADHDASVLARRDGGGGDAALDASLLGLPWSGIAPVPGLSNTGYNEDDPTLTGDLLEIYFDSDEPASGAAMGDIWKATRASVTDPWSAPTLVTELASLSDDTTPEVSLDGLTMYFASDRLTAGDRDIYVTTRASRADAWSTPTRVAELSSTVGDDGAEPLPDGLHLVMGRGANGSLDLMVATRPTTTSTWGTPVPLPGLDDPSYDESQQWSSPDIDVVYYVSNRPGSMSQDIWLATRPDAQATFTSTLVSELQSASKDVDPWVSPDGHTLFFASDRRGTMDIFMATR